MLPGRCCIAIAALELGNRRQLIPHVRFQVPFLGPESQLKSGFACAGLLCIPMLEVIQCYHLFWHVSDDHELTCWSPAVRFFRVFGLFVFVFLLLVWLSCVGCEVLRGDSPMDYVSIQFKSLLYAHCRHDWCCHCINSVNLQNAIIFPAW